MRGIRIRQGGKREREGYNREVGKVQRGKERENMMGVRKREGKWGRRREGEER